MTGFLARAAAAGLLALSLPAAAQVGPPVRLGPPPESPPPHPEAPAQPTSPESSTKSGIAVDQLAPPDPDAVGALGPGDARLPDGIWQGTSRSTVLTLLPKIAATTTPALQSLMFRLLASPVAPPAGDAPAGALLALRAERLASALGRPDAALTLLQAAPAAQGSEPIAEVSADLAFLAGNPAGACAIIRARQGSWQSSYWDQGQTACDALDGRESEARLGLDLLREAKVKDNGFSALVDRVLGGTAKLPDTLPSPQPMSLALVARLGVGLPRHALDSADLSVLHAVASNEGFPAEQRLAAAEKAATFGALSPDKLAEAYLAQPLGPEDRDSPLNQAQAAGGARGRAILFAAAHDAALPAARANFLAVLLQQAPKADLYFAIARAAKPILSKLEPSPDLSSVAPDFARALYVLDEPKQAAAWLAVAGADGAAVLPLAHIAAGDAAPAWDGQMPSDAPGGRDAAQRRAVLVTQLLAALGTPVPDGLAVTLLDAKVAVPASAGPGVLIESEAAGRHVGATVLAVGAALGEQGAQAPGVTLVQAVEGLRTVGLDEDARHLAVDGAIAAGL